MCSHWMSDDKWSKTESEVCTSHFQVVQSFLFLNLLFEFSLQVFKVFASLKVLKSSFFFFSYFPPLISCLFYSFVFFLSYSRTLFAFQTWPEAIRIQGRLSSHAYFWTRTKDFLSLSLFWPQVIFKEGEKGEKSSQYWLSSFFFFSTPSLSFSLSHLRGRT